jgi:hypothetical protein
MNGGLYFDFLTAQNWLRRHAAPVARFACQTINGMALRH